MPNTNNKNIAFVTSYPLSSEPVVKNRLNPYIKYMQSQGFLVSLISTDKEDLSEALGVEHIVVDRADRARGFIKRAFNEFIEAGRLLKRLKQTKIKTCIVTIPSMFLLFRLRILKDITVFLDIRDLTWEYLNNGSLVQRMFKRLARYIARSQLNKLDGVAVTNTTEYDYVRNKLKVDKSKISWVPNGVSLEQFTLLSGVSSANNNESVVSYIGNIGIAQNLTVLIDAASLLPNIKFYIVGDGTDRERVKAYSDSKDIKNVTFTGRVSWEETLNIYNQTNILFAQLDGNFSGAMPSKLYEYLATGKYVLYAGKGQAQEFLLDFDNNTVVEPNKVEDILQAINHIIKQNLHSSISNANKEKIKERYIREDNVKGFLQKVISCNGIRPEDK